MRALLPIALVLPLAGCNVTDVWQGTLVTLLAGCVLPLTVISWAFIRNRRAWRLELPLAGAFWGMSTVGFAPFVAWTFFQARGAPPPKWTVS